MRSRLCCLCLHPRFTGNDCCWWGLFPMASPQLPVSLFPVTVLIPSSSVGSMSFFWILKISSNVLILLPTPPQSWSHAGGLVLNHCDTVKTRNGVSGGMKRGHWGLLLGIGSQPFLLSFFLIVPSATYSVPSRTPSTHTHTKSQRQ